MRLFFAVELREDEAFGDLYRSLKDISWNLRPVRPENQHITLKFLGDPGRPVEEVMEAPQCLVESVEPFELAVVGMGAFPGWGRPSVLWLGLEPAGKLAELAKRLDGALNEKLGTPLEKRSFKAHITAARIKGKGSIPVERVKEIMNSTLERLNEGNYSLKVDRFHLINSTLTPQGPFYDILETYHLQSQ